jgi:hypothetical protein
MAKYGFDLNAAQNLKAPKSQGSTIKGAKVKRGSDLRTGSK